MAHPKISYALPMLLALAGLMSCRGESSDAPPRTAADQTTTTAGVAETPSTLPAATPEPAPVPASSTASASPSGSIVTTTAGATLSGAAAQATDTNGSADPGRLAGLTDDQIVAVIHAADRAEIEQAHEALRSAKSNRVKQFAQHMVLDQSAAETKISSLDTKAGITPETSAIADQVRADAMQVRSTLKSASGTAFDKAYIDAQVTEQTKVLGILDNQLIPRVQNGDLGSALQDIRGKVAARLKMAQGIQASLAQDQ